MGIIVAIGGLKNEIHDIKNICKKIIELSKKKKPNVLYVPTANNDNEKYSKFMANFFERNYSCTVSILWLIHDCLNIEDIDGKIKNADIVFVEGGNLVTLLETWKKYKLEYKLKDAYENGVIMSGISAGANCWFEYSYSDSVKDKEFNFIKGLGFIKGCICPHYDDKKRRIKFEKDISNLKLNSDIAYGIESNNAVIIDKERVTILHGETENSGVHLIKIK